MSGGWVIVGFAGCHALACVSGGLAGWNWDGHRLRFWSFLFLTVMLEYSAWAIVWIA